MVCWVESTKSFGSCHVITRRDYWSCVMVTQQKNLPKFCHFGKPQSRGSLEKSRFQFISQVGDGTYGEVFLAKAQDSRGVLRPYAIKQMKNTYLTWKDALKEMEIVVAGELKRHPNIIHMLEAFREFQQLYMVFEFMDCNLYQLMKDRSIKRFTEDETRSISGQIFCGLQYLHEKGFFHRDLKPENILCNGTELVKIADFGQARYIRSRPPYTEYVSTRWYRAPELVLSSRIYGLGVDIWAVGCIIAEIVTLRPLFDGATAADQLLKIVKLLGTPKKEDWLQGFDLADHIKMSFPAGFERQNLSLFIKPASVSCEEVISATLRYNPQARPSAKSCLQMPFFTRLTSNHRSRETTAAEKPSVLKRQSLADPTFNPTAKPKPEILLPKSLPLDSLRVKVLQDVADLSVQGPGSLPRRPAYSPGKPSIKSGSKPTEILQKQSLLRRHESQNIIPTPKCPPVGLPVVSVKNPVQKLVAQNVTKSSTSPDLSAATQANSTGPGKPRFRTDHTSALPPAHKQSHLQRILVPRRDSRRNLDPNQSTEIESRRLLEANHALRKISTDSERSERPSVKAGLTVRGSSTSPTDEFPDPFMSAARDASNGIGDRRINKSVETVVTGPDKPWMGMTKNFPSKAHRLSTPKTLGSLGLNRSSAQLNPGAKCLQIVPLVRDRRSQEPSWWDK